MIIEENFIFDKIRQIETREQIKLKSYKCYIREFINIINLLKKDVTTMKNQFLQDKLIKHNSDFLIKKFPEEISLQIAQELLAPVNFELSQINNKERQRIGDSIKQFKSPIFNNKPKIQKKSGLLNDSSLTPKLEQGQKQSLQKEMQLKRKKEIEIEKQKKKQFDQKMKKVQKIVDTPLIKTQPQPQPQKKMTSDLSFLLSTQDTSINSICFSNDDEQEAVQKCKKVKK